MLLKICLFGLFVWFIARQVNAELLITALGRFSFWSIAAVFICGIARLLVLSKRMQHAAGLTNIKLPYGKIVLWEFEILFLEQVIPIPNAEDLFRVFFWRKYKAKIASAMSALLFSRICGLFTISILLPFTLNIIGENVLKQRQLPPGALWLLPGFILIITLLHKRILRFLASGSAKIKFMPVSVSAIISRMADNNFGITDYLFAIVLILFQFCFISGAFYALAFDARAPVSYLQLYLSGPLIVLAFLVPFSVQGLGIPEAVMVWVMIHFGVKSETAAAISIVHFACYVLLILAAGVIALSKNRLAEVKNALADYKKAKSLNTQNPPG